ncbi:tetratricopeptide repeat protein, partial [Lysinibacillus sphaericus]
MTNLYETQYLKELIELYLLQISEYIKVDFIPNNQQEKQVPTVLSNMIDGKIIEDEDITENRNIRYEYDQGTILIEGFSQDNSFLFNNKGQFSFVNFLIKSILDELNGFNSIENMLNENINFKILNIAEEFIHLILKIENNKESNLNFLNYIEKISMLNYEGGSVSAKLLIINKEIREKNIDLVLTFNQAIEYKETKKIRKIFEMSSNEIFVIGDTNRIYGLGKFKDTSLLEMTELENNFVMINFEGKMDYKINLIEFDLSLVEKIKLNLTSETCPYSERLIIGFKDKCILLNKFEFPTDKLKSEINKTFRNYFDEKEYNEIQINEKVNSIFDIIEIASHQKCGTMVVITTPNLAESEINRLNSQCFRVDQYDMLNLSNPTISNTLINQLTSIDGALYIDIESKCHAIGVILDGLATDEADSSRGARYNSALRYQKMDKFQNSTKLSNDCLVVVISEDGMIDIVGNRVENFESNKNELNLLFDREFYLEVIKKASQYLKINESIIDYYLIRAKAYSKLNKINKAINDYDNAINIDPIDVRIYFNRGYLYDTSLAQYNEALADYSKALAINPSAKEVYIRRGNLYKKLDKNKEALADYNKALEIDPNYSIAYYNRGNLHKKLERKEAALVDYSKSIELNPNYALAYNNRGNLYKDIGNINAALADYCKALEINSKFAFAYNNRGILLKEINKN